ncbi:MAG: hypothetical protein EA424_04475, partial [Planctomycetaceae bacterium]
KGTGVFSVIPAAFSDDRGTERIVQVCPLGDFYHPVWISKKSVAPDALSQRLQFSLAERLFHTFDPVQRSRNRPMARAVSEGGTIRDVRSSEF